MPPEMISRMRRPCSTTTLHGLPREYMVRRAPQGYHKLAAGRAPRWRCALRRTRNNPHHWLVFRVGRCQMVDTLTPDDGGSGEATAGDDRGLLKPPREPVAHYR